MSYTYTLLQQVDTPAGSLSQSISATGEADIEMEVAIPAATDTQVDLQVPYANIKALYWLADVAMTVETNSGSAADQTISLAAGVPLVWITGGIGSNPITDNITALYVTAASAGTLKIRVLYDPTPA